MTDALSRQHGGDHYKKQAIQPIQLSMANNYDACIHSSMKYVSRHRDKAGKQDLMKAHHFCELRVETMTLWTPRAIAAISIEEYIAQNGIQSKEAAILRNLDAWARGTHGMSDGAACALIQQQIMDLMYSAYVESKAPDKPQPEANDDFPDFMNGDL